MTSNPPRRAERRQRPDLWRYPPEAGDGRARPSQADGGQPGRDQPSAGRPGRGQPREQPGRGLPGVGRPVWDAEVNLAVLGYLGAVFTGPVIPLGVYLIGRRMSPFTRHHAAMALNLALTGLLYAVCCLIFGAVLLLDSRTVALVVAIPIAVVLWAYTLRYLFSGMDAARYGAQDTVPAWICARLVR
jgi:hypothetical protein